MQSLDESWNTLTPSEINFCRVCGSYNPEIHVYKTTDGRGHSTLLTVRVPPNIPSEIAQIVESRRYEYRTSQDVIRDAIFHYLLFLKSHQCDSPVIQTLNAMESTHNLMLEHYMYQEIIKQLEDAEQVVQFLWKNKQPVRARKFVADFMERAEQIGDEAYRQIYMDKLEKLMPPEGIE